MPSRKLLTIAYDGRPYHGWQLQPDKATIQETLEKALSTIAKAPIHIQGSGRTDTGVHARAQRAHFDCPDNISMDHSAWQRALHSHLPSSIRILKIEDVAPDFHARFSAKQKTYHYHIHTATVLPPWQVGLTCHQPQLQELEALEALEKGCQLIQGEHDFAAFAANRGEGMEPSSTVRTIHRLELVKQSDELVLQFTGNGFLYKMVRLLTGSLLRVAGGRMELETVTKHLEQPKLGTLPYCAPADGLYLFCVEY